MPYKIALESGTHPAKSLNLLHQIVYSPSRLHTRTKRKTTSFQLPNLNGNSERVMMIEHLDLDLSIRFYEKFPYLYSSIRVYAYIYSEFIQEVMLLVDLSRTLRLFLQDSGGHAFKSLSNRKKRRRRMVLAILKNATPASAPESKIAKTWEIFGAYQVKSPQFGSKATLRSCKGTSVRVVK